MRRFIIPVVIVAALAILSAIISGASPTEAQGNSPPAANVQVVNGPTPGTVIVHWDAVPEATHYGIGYVNLLRDHPQAKAGATGNWRETFGNGFVGDRVALQAPATDCSGDDYDRDEWGEYPGADADAVPTWTLPSDDVASAEITLDHHVALKDAHVSGGCDWTTAMKNGFAMDPANLNPTTRSFNSSKGSRTPDRLTGIAQRIIDTDDEQCDYATQHDEVKDQYDLSMTESERETVTQWLALCVESPGGESATMSTTRPSMVSASYSTQTGSVEVSWTPDVDAQQHWVVLFSLPSYEHGGRVLVRGADADAVMFEDVPPGRYEALVASYSRDVGFEYGDDTAFELTIASASTPDVTPQDPLSNAELASLVKPALVNLEVTPSDGETYGGTGFVVRSDGLVVTNRHVVDDAEIVTGLMNIQDGPPLEFTGQVLGRGILVDLAVIKLDSSRTFGTLPLGDSDTVAFGDEVTAWGYPLSSFLGTDPTLTRGIISSPNRILEDTKYLQIDADLAPGNSGGPLIDRYGHVVGVNTAGVVIIDENGTRIPVAGIYLSIASSEVSDRLDTLESGGPVQATYHNLRFDYGYSMDIPKGWYLESESQTTSRFLPYTGRRFANIGTLPLIEPLLSKSGELDLLAGWIWDTFLPEYAADNWDYFQNVSARKITQGGQEFYRLEYRARWEPGLCILRHVELVSISSTFPDQPLGFITTSAVCEDSLATYTAERDTMLASFRP